MEPYAITSEGEIAWVGPGRAGWVGRHLLKSQDSAVVVFSSGRIGNSNDWDSAGDHDGRLCLSYPAWTNSKTLQISMTDVRPQFLPPFDGVGASRRIRRRTATQ